MLTLGLGLGIARNRSRAPAVITGQGPVLSAAEVGQTLAEVTSWGSYAPAGHSTQRQMQRNGGIWQSYEGTTLLAAGESWRLGEIVSFGATSKTFRSETRSVAGELPPTGTTEPA